MIAQSHITRNHLHHWNFVQMVQHVGKALSEVLKSSRIEPVDFLNELPYSESQMYRHFKSKDLSTAVLRKYDKTFNSMGYKVDLFHFIAEPTMTIPTEIGSSTVAEPEGVYHQEAQTADIQEIANLLRRSAELIEKSKLLKQ